MSRFADWYVARHGYAPFPWQASLAERIAADDWPEAVTAPTGSGKTAVIDVWLWARLQGLPVPRRLVYVIDRRLVVDGVTDYAAALASSLPDAERPSLVTMRGGIAIDDDWVRDPLRPAVIVSTVDQAGSRLLFAGYGISRKAAPIHAGLLGNDALFVLDEVHLAQPLLETLRSVALLRGDSVPLPWRVLVMSATWESHKTHGLGTADDAHPALSRRLGAAKPARLVKLASEDDMAPALANEAKALRTEGAGVVAVVCNRVARARAVFEGLCKEGDAVLLTGRIRPIDKQTLHDEYLPRMATGSREGRTLLYVVATQTIEVGADLDVDGLVTECAPLSALRQRAGRLNRLGELTTAPMCIVHQQTKRDPVYGNQINATWKWLKRVARGKPPTVDFGIRAMEALMAADPPTAEDKTSAPALLPAHVDLLTQTSVGHGIEVAPWLHGWEAGAPDVYLCWRADFSPEAIAAAPPAQHELLAIPLYALQRWSADVADIEGGAARRERGGQKAVGCIRWDGECTAVIDTLSAEVGDTLVLPVDAGACDRYGWAPRSADPVSDVGDSERRVRLHAAVHPELSTEIEALLEDDATTPDDWRALARRAALKDPGRVLAYPGGCVVLNRSEWTPASGFRPIPLRTHQQQVSARAEALAKGSGLTPELVDAVRRAGAGHDSGKLDPRWQAMVGGDGMTALAKGPGGDTRWLSLPRGWRHEMASALHQSDPLVRHLVGTHHGNGRPLLPAAPDPALWRQLSDWPEQFADLQQQFGPWGLAYLETLVRLADWTVSEEEQA